MPFSSAEGSTHSMFVIRLEDVNRCKQELIQKLKSVCNYWFCNKPAYIQPNCVSQNDAQNPKTDICFESFTGGRAIHLRGVCGTSAGQRWTRFAMGVLSSWCVLCRYWLGLPGDCRRFCCLRLDEIECCPKYPWKYRCNLKLWALSNVLLVFFDE